jgi:catechol 2,3-dioxygenase-like lactoylglutathione lyase family enzyme
VSDPLKQLGAITMFVDDRQRSKAFYDEVFDASLVHEDDDGVAFRFDNTIVNLLERRAAPELIEPAPVAEPGAGSQFQLTIFVDDTDAVCARLAERGVQLLNGPVNREWGVRTAAFADPDGHVWEVAGKIPTA